ncbi:MAG: hypothetical protein ACRDGQ_01885 [Candidatus Limnocylindrales bacterium]
MSRNSSGANRRTSGPDGIRAGLEELGSNGLGSDDLDSAGFVRGLTIGLVVGAVIAGSTLWRRFGNLRKRT